MMAVTDLDQFQQLLTTLLSVDNDARSVAEEAYKNIPTEARVEYLLQFICNASISDEIRNMAAVLLRRLFSLEFMQFYPKLSPLAQAQLKEQILLSVQNEQKDTIRRKICEVASEVARNLIDEDGTNRWPEFLQFLFQCANSSVPALKESALRMFTSIPGVFGNQQAIYLHLIKQMLHQSIMDADNYEVRFQAMKAIGAFIMIHDKETKIHTHFAELLPAMIDVTMQSVEKQEDEALLKVLVDIGEIVPKFLRIKLDSIMEMCINIISNTEISDSWRHMALEVLVTLAETAPSMLRKIGGKHIPSLIQIILKMMTDLEDDDEWAFIDEVVEEDNDSNSVVAESALDRLACGLGGKQILLHVIEYTTPMLNGTWKDRHAALMAISAIGEGCHKQMESFLPPIVRTVVTYFTDQHPRVRFAACNAVGQMSTDFAPVFEKKFHDKVIPGLLMLLDDNDNPRVQAHAGAALVNFSEDCPKQILTPYLDAIMSKLEFILSAKFQELLVKGTKLVLEQIVTTIASVADTCEEQFINYYDKLVPCLKYIIQNGNSEEHKLMRGKAIECVTLIGLAVGFEKFQADAEEIMALLLKTYEEQEISEDDPQISYMISAWARICKLFGKHFEKYLPRVMGPVLQTAGMKPEVALLDNEDMEDVEQDVDWQFVSLGEQQNFGIKTAGLEDKVTACEMLVCYARELKEGFAGYAEQVVKLMVPLLKFYFHDGVRSAAAQSLPCLLECAKIKGPQYVEGMWAYICPDLLRAIDSEPETDVLQELLFSLAKCIETLGAGCMSTEYMTEMLRILDKHLNVYFEKYIERSLLRQDEDYDEAVEESLDLENREDIHTLSKIADILHSLFLTHKTAFFPYFDQICGHFVKLMGPERPWADHQWALCVFDDVIEFGGPDCVKYQEYFLRPMMQYLTDKSPEVRQVAAYGCGVLAQFGGDGFAHTCAEAVPILMEVIASPEARSTENIYPTENAISAVTKILKYNNKAINVDEILPHWLLWLPVYEDVEEAHHVYGYLCDLIEANHPIVLGPNNTNLPRLITFFAEAMHSAAIPNDHPLMARILSIVNQIQTNDSMFQACLSGLSQEQLQALHEALHAQQQKQPSN